MSDLREMETNILDTMGIDDFLSDVHDVDGRDKELKLFLVWCVERCLPFSKNGYNSLLLKYTKSYINGEWDRVEHGKVILRVKNRWGRLRHDNRTQQDKIELMVTTAVLYAALFALSDCTNAVLWAQYSSALLQGVCTAAEAIALAAPEEMRDLTRESEKTAQTDELRRVCT